MALVVGSGGCWVLINVEAGKLLVELDVWLSNEKEGYMDLVLT